MGCHTNAMKRQTEATKYVREKRSCWSVLGEFLRSCADVRLQLTEETKGDILISFKRFMRFLLFFDRDEFTLLDWGQLNLLNSQIA